MSKPPIMATQDELMGWSPTVRESRRPLQKRKESCHHRTRFSCLCPSNTHFTLQILLLYAQLKVRNQSPGAANCGKPASMHFCVPCRSWVFVRKKVWQIAARWGADSSKICCLIVEARWLRERWDEPATHLYQLRTQLCYIQDTLDHKKAEFSAFFAEHYRFNNERHQYSSATDH